MSSEPPVISHTGKGDPEYAILLAGKKDPSVPFYILDVRDKVSPHIAELLQNYAGIQPEEAPEHLQDIRDKAWSIRAYPCIGLAVFFQAPLLPTHWLFPNIVKKIREDEQAIFLDVGPFLGIELRALLLELAGTDTVGRRANWARQLVGVDVVSFWELGHEMFRDDYTKCPIRFVNADAFDSSRSTRMEEFVGKIEFVNVGQVFHQFDLNGQSIACKSLTKLLRGPGSTIIGNQLGSSHAKERPLGRSMGYSHNPQSWKDMWKKIEAETGARFEVEAELRSWEQCGIDPESTKYTGEDSGLLFFACKMVSVP